MRVRGVVKFFNYQKGYGFIAPEDGSRDIFVHITTVQKAGIPYLYDGTRLSFDTAVDSRGRGLQATELLILEDE